MKKRRKSYECCYVGSLRWKAAVLLTEAIGYPVYPENIKTVEGYYRSQDVYRFEVFTHNGNMPEIFGCWETLTYFVKHGKKDGVEVERKRNGEWIYEVGTKNA